MLQQWKGLLHFPASAPIDKQNDVGFCYSFNAFVEEKKG